MDQLTTTIDVDAPPETVWRVLTDFAAYPEWNDYTRIEGSAVEGTTLTVSPGPAAGRLPTFRPEVRRAEENRELRWIGHLLVRGLYDGEHRFVVEDRGNGRSRLTQAETFTGVLVWPVNRLFGEGTRRNFEAVNAALKARAESLAAGERAADDPTDGVDDETADEAAAT